MKQNASSSKTQIIIVATLIGLGLLGLIALLAYVFRANISQLTASATQTPPIPTLFVPTRDCGSPTLLLGTSSFSIQNLTPAADHSLSVPSDKSGIAYWVEGTNTHPIFVINPTPENMTVMSAVSVGSPVKVTWSNCNSTTYSLAAAQAGVLDIPAMSDQSAEEITVFFETDVSGAGFIFKGELTEQQISTFNTPAASDVQAEIGLVETTASQDGTTLRIGVTVNNYGQTALPISASDVSLTPLEGAPLIMVSSEPSLPKEIVPGATETLYFTFPRPTTATAVLKVFTVEYDLEGY